MRCISVCITAKDRPGTLVACLRSLARQTRHPDEVVLLDQSEVIQRSTIVSILQPAGITLHYEHTPHLQGLTQARNRALARARGDVLVFLDDDVELEATYLQVMEGVFEEDRTGQVGGASGFTTNFLSTLTLPQLVRSWLFYRGPFAVERDPILFHLHRGTRSRRARRLHGSNMAFRRAVFETMRFDEAYTGYGFGEDRDFSVQLAQRFELRWVPQARLIHHVASQSRLSRERFCELRVLSWLRFYRQCVPPSPSAMWWYIWLNAGFVLLLAQGWDLPTVRGTYRGLRRLVRILLGREKLERALADRWQANARVLT